MRQLVQEQTSLWRIKNEYIKDSEDCEKCEEFWKKLAEDKEKHLKELEILIEKCKKDN